MLSLVVCSYLRDASLSVSGRGGGLEEIGLVATKIEEKLENVDR